MSTHHASWQENSLKRLHRQTGELCLTPQNVKELWNVCTRPTDYNGLGVSVQGAERHTRMLEKYFTILPDSALTYQIWRKLLSQYGISGAKVHDAYLVAAMKVHQVGRILTFNIQDFARQSDIEAIHPQAVTEA